MLAFELITLRFLRVEKELCLLLAGLSHERSLVSDNDG